MLRTWYPNATCPPIFSATFRPFCAVFLPFFYNLRLPGAKTERTGEKWRKMGEIWGRNGRETAVAEWRWAQRDGSGRRRQLQCGPSDCLSSVCVAAVSLTAERMLFRLGVQAAAEVLQERV